MSTHDFTGAIYGDNTGTQSSIGQQTIPFFYYRKAIFDIRNKKIFTQLANPIKMPKNQGKVIKIDRYIPLLDDENINTEGIDATANHDEFEVTIVMTNPDGMIYRAVGQGKTGNALTEAKKVAFTYLKNLNVKEATTDYDTSKTALERLGWSFEETAERPNYGNMYGSSKDIGTITGKLPLIPETGGRYNRVGFIRKQIQSHIENYGFFREYTEDSLQFDNEPKLLEYITREALIGANEIVEDKLQMDLLNGAGITMYGGDASSLDTLTGNEGETPSTLTYDTLVKLSIILDEKKCPTDTEIITGSRNIDTKTVNRARFAYIGNELMTTLLRMKNYHDKEAFIPARMYASGTTLAVGEVGAIDGFRFIVANTMLHWEGKGATVTTNGGYYEGANGKYNVYPMLVVGSKSFNTLNFENDGIGSQFKIMHKKPGIDTMTESDPFGKIGRWSIQWWYGFIVTRPEHIAVVKVVAEK